MLLDEARPMLERLDERVAEVNRRLIREHEVAEEAWDAQMSQWNAQVDQWKAQMSQ